MPWQTLCINAESKISLDQNNIVIKKADGSYQSYNLRAIDCVIFNNARLIITLPIITALIEHNTTSIINMIQLECLFLLEFIQKHMKN